MDQSQTVNGKTFIQGCTSHINTWITLLFSSDHIFTMQQWYNIITGTFRIFSGNNLVQFCIDEGLIYICSYCKTNFKDKTILILVMNTWMVDHYIQVNWRLMANTVLNFQIICLSLIKWTSFIEKSYQNWTKVWLQNLKFWNFIKYLGLIHTEFLVISLVLVM